MSSVLDLESLKNHVLSICETYGQLLEDKLTIKQAKTAIQLRLNILKKYELNNGDYESRIEQILTKNEKFVTLSLNYKSVDKNVYGLYMSLIPQGSDKINMLIPGYKEDTSDYVDHSNITEALVRESHVQIFTSKSEKSGDGEKSEDKTDEDKTDKDKTDKDKTSQDKESIYTYKSSKPSKKELGGKSSKNQVLYRRGIDDKEQNKESKYFSADKNEKNSTDDKEITISIDGESSNAPIILTEDESESIISELNEKLSNKVMSSEAGTIELVISDYNTNKAVSSYRTKEDENKIMSSYRTKEIENKVTSKESEDKVALKVNKDKNKESEAQDKSEKSIENILDKIRDSSSNSLEMELLLSSKSDNSSAKSSASDSSLYEYKSGDAKSHKCESSESCSCGSSSSCGNSDSCTCESSDSALTSSESSSLCSCESSDSDCSSESSSSSCETVSDSSCSCESSLTSCESSSVSKSCSSESSLTSCESSSVSKSCSSESSSSGSCSSATSNSESCDCK